MTLDLHSVALEPNERAGRVTPIATGLPLAIGACLHAIATSLAHEQRVAALPAAPLDLLVQHVHQHKQNLYGFHLAGSEADRFARSYDEAYNIELSTIFAGLSASQRQDIERGIDALEIDDWEFKHLYRRWCCLQSAEGE
jgi:hypothetical protein